MEEHGEMVPDAIRDDQSLIIKLSGRGLVVISGCAHSGIINSVLYARQLTGESRVAAVIGGFHLSGSDMEPLIESTLSELKQLITRPHHAHALHRLECDTALAERISRVICVEQRGHEAGFAAGVMIRVHHTNLCPASLLA